ncbi:MAG: CHASE2 domain-containing protein [Magnetococcales bacterium]|nr:CHASE2 domain-containing protein [Magnetococcales bacterium]
MRRIRPRRHALFTLAVFIIVALAEYVEVFSLLEDQSLTVRHMLRMRYGAPEQTHFSDDIVFVSLDDAFFEDYGSYPIRRRDLGTLVRNLHRLGARSVGIDLLFDYPDTYGEDPHLISALAGANNVTLAAIAKFDENKTFSALRRAHPEISARAGSGYVNVVSQSFVVKSLSRIRVIPEAAIKERAWPLAIAVLANHLNVTPVLTADRLQLGSEIDLTLDQFNDYYISFPALPGEITNISHISGIGALDFLELEQLGPMDQRELRDWVNGKIVLIGDATTISNDRFNTPVGMVYGVEFIGMAIDTLMKNAPLRPFPTSVEIMIAALFALFMIWLGTIHNLLKRNALALLPMALYLCAATLAFIHLGWIASLTYVTLGWLITLIGINLHFYLHERFLRRQAASKLASLVDVGVALSSERQFDTLLNRMLEEARKLANAQGGSFFMVEDDTQLTPVAVRDTVLNISQLADFNQRDGSITPPFPPVKLFTKDGEKNLRQLSSICYWTKELRHSTDIYASDAPELEGVKAFDKSFNFRTHSVLTVPMVMRTGKVVGVLQLINPIDPETGKPTDFIKPLIPVIDAFASQAAVAKAFGKGRTGPGAIFMPLWQ